MTKITDTTPQSWTKIQMMGFPSSCPSPISSDETSGVHHVFTLQGCSWRKKIISSFFPFSEALQKSLASWKFSGQICMDFSVGMYISCQQTTADSPAGWFRWITAPNCHISSPQFGGIFTQLSWSQVSKLEIQVQFIDRQTLFIEIPSSKTAIDR